MFSLQVITVALLLVFCQVLDAKNASSLCKSVAGCNVLVALNRPSEEALYSKFIGSLRSRGFNVTVSAVTSFEKSSGEFSNLYRHVVMVGVEAKTKGDGLQPKNILDYVSREKMPINLIWAGSSSMRNEWSDFALNFGIDMDESNTAVFDHFSWLNSPGNDNATGRHSLVTSSRIYPNSHVFTNLRETDGGKSAVAFRGIAHRLTGKNALAFPLLYGNPTSYSYLIDDDMPASSPHIAGGELLFASAVQLLNNARVVFLGSSELLTDKFFDLSQPDRGVEQTANELFARDVSEWAFQEKAMLKLQRVHYHLLQSKEIKAHEFRVKEEIEYEIDLSQWKDGAFVPFLANDLQVEAVMLDPYVRKTLTPTTSSLTAQRYSTQFQLPDVHGVFTLKLEYRRLGLAYIEHSETVNVRPFRHDEYDRFIPNAYPYYVSSFSMMVAFIIFSVLWLFNKDSR